jgi:hypothetical protein
VPRTQTLVVALSLGLAAVFGIVALTKTVHLGRAAAAMPVSERLIAKRNAQLDRFEASLRAELRKHPAAVPKLPSVPVAAPAAATPSAAPAPAAAPAASGRVVYVRPAPIIVHKHRAGGEHESESSDHSDSSHGGGGGDD